MNTWKRNWDGVCVYTQWEANDLKWTIEDLNPEHDELVLEIMTTQFVHEETIASSSDTRLRELNGYTLSEYRSRQISLDLESVTSGELPDITATEIIICVPDHEESLNCLKALWGMVISTRMSLACYVHKDGKKELAGLNLCYAKSEEDAPMNEDDMKGEKFKIMFGIITYFDKVIDMFKELDVKLFLSGAGLYVLPEYRGFKLGGKILAARETMCHQQGIPAASTIFTGPASQRLATINGYRTVFETTIEELVAKTGHILSGDQTRNLKMMVKNY